MNKQQRKAIGSKLSHVRSKARKTQKDVSEMIYVSPATVSNLETGARHVGFHLILAYAEAFGISLQEVDQIIGKGIQGEKSRSCEGKVAHKTKQAAHMAIKTMKRKATYAGHIPYKCEYCKKYHNGRPGTRGRRL